MRDVDNNRNLEERRLKVFENWLLKRIFGPRKIEVQEEWRNYVMRSLTFRNRASYI
jgi:hypothetical protein